MNKISKVINIFLSIGLIFISLAVAYIAFPQFGNQALIVRSGSMTPTIDVGSIVVSRPSDHYAPGDVIAFRSETKKDTISSIIERLQSKTAEEGSSEIKATLPGVVYDIKIKKGDQVKQGQSLFSVMAMKMENDITAPRDCKIKEIKVKKDGSVNKGDVLAVIE